MFTRTPNSTHAQIALVATLLIGSTIPSLGQSTPAPVATDIYVKVTYVSKQSPIDRIEDYGRILSMPPGGDPTHGPGVIQTCDHKTLKYYPEDHVVQLATDLCGKPETPRFLAGDFLAVPFIVNNNVPATNSAKLAKIFATKSTFTSVEDKQSLSVRFADIAKTNPNIKYQFIVIGSSRVLGPNDITTTPPSRPLSKLYVLDPAQNGKATAFIPMPQSDNTITNWKNTTLANIDCTQAQAMFTDAVKTQIPPLTGDIDKDFALIVSDHEKSTAKIMNIEALCGKNPKMKDMAAKQSTDATARMTMFRNQNMSQ